ncbi:MAG: hypothetical protein F6J98_32845 [Moorea sp. SIO4G2]|uniref:hypothetical protein n=1 Tax=Moorena sp. SIO3F7 TaxID=2607839 RepID=UPI0013F8D836|nr:hypothetical protein [Moorena sp. SIO3F7]NEO10890.1 hypothetical protein [Moorena sp. SIO3E8]NEO64930.1 hypothetical protein [Moorena sp. SIO4G2]NEP97419.1 hypothetical protein [Moorena sp. SIO3F7]
MAFGHASRTTFNQTTFNQTTFNQKTLAFWPFDHATRTATRSRSTRQPMKNGLLLL